MSERDDYRPTEGPCTHFTEGPGGDTYCQRDPRPGDAIADGHTLRYEGGGDNWFQKDQQPTLVGFPAEGPDPCTRCLQRWERQCPNCRQHGFACTCPCPECLKAQEAAEDETAMCGGCMASACEDGEREAGWDATP
jgi:hypothetical protein